MLQQQLKQRITTNAAEACCDDEDVLSELWYLKLNRSGLCRFVIAVAGVATALVAAVAVAAVVAACCCWCYIPLLSLLSMLMLSLTL